MSGGEDCAGGMTVSVLVGVHDTTGFSWRCLVLRSLYSDLRCCEMNASSLSLIFASHRLTLVGSELQDLSRVCSSSRQE